MNTPKITPEEIGIIKDAKAGKESAFNMIYYKYKEFVISLLYQYLNDMDEAKDLSNIVFLKVYQKLSKFTDYSSFGGWLRILTKNTAIDYLRTLKNKAISIDDQENGIQLSNISNVADENRSLTYTNLIEMFDSLPETNKKVVKLYYESGMTVAQISKAMNVPVGTIKSYLYRTRNNLKKQLKLC
jgi:RNA polymerase sigma-70 factor (ECF subfamily)